MSSLLNIGASGLAAAYAGLSTAGHNVANVNTPGFSRQQTVQTTMPGQFTGAGFIGSGVSVQTVQRAFDQQLTNQVQYMSAQSSAASTHQALMQRVDRLFANDESGLGGSLDRFFSSITEASSRPADMAARATVLASATQLAERIRSTGAQLEALGQSADQGIRATVANINQLTKHISDLNDAIAVGRGSGQPPNDLLDQRDQTVNDLSKLVGVNTVEQSDGSLNVFMSSGAALVVGNISASLAVSADPSIPGHQVISVNTGGTGVVVTADAVTGGQLSALMKFRDVTLVNTQNDLGRFAYSIGDAYNQVHAAGTDLNGAPGAPLFTIGAPQSYTGAGNTSGASLTVSVTSANALQASDYRLDFDGANYTVTRVRDGNRTTSASLPVTIDGLNIVASGAINAGDSFTIQPSRGVPAGFTAAITNTRALAFAQSAAANDNRNALSLAAISTSPMLGSLNVSQVLGEMAATVGATVRSLRLDSDASQQLLGQALTDQSAVSGVNLDEEAAKLMRYQQAYQASAKVMATAQTIFQTLLDLGR